MEDLKSLLTFIETRPFITDLDFQNPILNNIADYGIDLFQSIILYGRPGTGKTTKIYSLMASLTQSSDVYSIKTTIFEKDKKEIQYKYSPYHIEFSPLDLSSYESIFIEGFLRDYVKSKNVGHDIPKIVYIKNAEYLSSKTIKALGIMMEKNIMTSRFILECNSITCLADSLKGRCVKIRLAYPERGEIEMAMRRMVKKYYDRDLTEEEIENAFDIGDFNDRSLKHIFSRLNTYLICGNWVRLMTVNKIENLCELIFEEDNMKSSIFEKIRELIQELYIDLVQMDKLFEYIYRKILDKYKNENDFCMKIVETTAEYDRRMKLGNKLTIHVETYIIHLLELIYEFNEEKKRQIELLKPQIMSSPSISSSSSTTMSNVSEVKGKRGRPRKT